MIEKSHEELIQASQEDIDFFNKCVSGLPTREGFNGDYIDKFGKEIPYGSSPHIVRHFKKTLEIVRPMMILEIGFNCGWSAALWLNLSKAGLVSMDISENDETVFSADNLEKQFKSNFSFKHRDYDIELMPGVFDLAFIDGDHREPFIIKDIELCKRLNIPYILFDDCYERYGETMAAIKHFPELELVHDMDNLRLYKFTT